MTLDPALLADYLPGDGPIPIVDFLEWKDLDPTIHAALALAYHCVSEFRDHITASFGVVLYAVLDNPTLDYDAAYHPPTSTIFIRRDILDSEGLDVIAGLLIHELVHHHFATNRTTPFDAATCFQEELICSGAGALVFGLTSRRRHLPEKSGWRYQEWVEMYKEARESRMQPRVLLSKGYQRHCLGRELATW